MISLKVKTLDCLDINIEIAENQNINDLKNQIHGMLGEDFLPENQKLILEGKELYAETNQIKDLNTEKAPIVVIGYRVRKPAKDIVQVKNTISSASKDDQEASKKAKNVVADPNAIQVLLDMGFEKNKVVSALESANNNVEAATSILCNKVDDESKAAVEASKSSAAGSSANLSKEELVQKVVEILSSVDLNRTENLDGSEELPRIEDVCDIMMKKDPEVFEQVIQNPDIFRSAYERVLSVMADHDDHLDEIDEMYDDGADPDADIEGHLNEFLGGDDNMDITESAADIVANAELTARDEENIQSLLALGFDRERAVEAYILCDRNIEMAASWLLEEK